MEIKSIAAMCYVHILLVGIDNMLNSNSFDVVHSAPATPIKVNFISLSSLVQLFSATKTVHLKRYPYVSIFITIGGENPVHQLWSEPHDFNILLQVK